MNFAAMPKLETDQETVAPTILPGATIGMVGGGQLGRMFAMAAASMGYKVIVFCGNDDEPAAQVADGVVTGELTDHEAVKEFASHCDVITLEFENIPAETIQRCSEYAPTYPSYSVLQTAQNRLTEKSTFKNAGLPVTPFLEVSNSDQLIDFARQHNWPVILKSATSGYDGKGQHRVQDEEHARAIDWSATDLWIAEQCIDFCKEISMIVARRPDGVAECFPAMENVHRNHILDITTTPAEIPDQLTKQAHEVAIATANLLDVVGLLCVEMFVVEQNGQFELMINEVAPRPHNSGHLTIEAFQTSQFQQHLRAICSLPLGSTELAVGGAAMANLLGDHWDGGAPAWDRALNVQGVNLHLYGKSVAKAGRKMGHLTATATDTDLARQMVIDARKQLE